MKLICLNLWGGKIYKPLMDFIKKNSRDTDIFCFQEVFKTTSKVKIREERRMNLYDEISEVLINHQGYFSSFLENYIIFSRLEVREVNFNLSYGLAIFIKKEIGVTSVGNFFIYGNKNSFNPYDLNSIPKILQYVTFTKTDKTFTVCNLHGIWSKQGKGDNPSRLEQSSKINKFLGDQPNEKILCGDFNLGINTRSIKMLEENMRNLIKEYHVPATRNKYFPGEEKYADYIFVSKGINVVDFKVPSVEVSDHLPLVLEFS